MAFIPSLPLRLHHTPTPILRPPRKAFPTSSLQTALGLSNHPETPTALTTALNTALQKVPSPTLALLSTTVSHDLTHIHTTLRARLPNIQIHGATSCATVPTTSGALPNGLGLLLISTPSMHTAAAPLSTSAAEAGRAAATQLAERMDGRVKHVVLQATPGIEKGVLDGVADVLGDVPVFGGSAADDTVEGKWRLLTSEGVLEAGVSLVGVGEDVKFGASVVGPYVATGRCATVTAAEGRTLRKLDGRAAGEVLAGWVGEKIERQCREGGSVLVEMAAFPLGVVRGGEFVGVHVASVDTDGALELFNEVQVGEVLTVMERVGSDSADAAKGGLQRAYGEAVRLGGLTAPKAGLLVFCGGLGIAVGDGLDRSLEGVKDAAPLLGVTAFGEQGRFGGGNFHCNLAVGVALFE